MTQLQGSEDVRDVRGGVMDVQWLLLTSIFIFLMQLGFAMLEVCPTGGVL